jgi:hypothetical protein
VGNVDDGSGVAVGSGPVTGSVIGFTGFAVGSVGAGADIARYAARNF